MSSIKKRCISGLLSLALIFTLIFSVFPPVESFAAAPKSTFPNKTETMYIGEDYDFTGKATAVGSDISIVHVDIQGPDTQTKGVSYFREEDIGSSTFSYSNIDEFTWGDRLYSCQSNAAMETSEPGKYWVIVYTKAEDGYTTTRTHIINLKLETPELSTHDGNEWLPYDEDHTFKWYSVPGASYYEVSVVSYDEKNKAYNIYTNKEVSTSKRSITVDAEDLFAGGALAVYITAYTDGGASSKASYVFPMEYEEKYLTVSDCDDLDPEKGSTAVFYVNTNVDFTVTSSKSWVTWSKVKQDDTHYKLTLKATSANTGTSDRSAKITVSGDGVDSESFYVYQLAPEIELPSISNISVSQNVTLGDEITWSAYIEGNGSLLETVTVGVFSEQLSSSIYFRNTNIGKETYSLTGSVLTGGIVNGYDDSGNPKTLNLGLPGNYTVTFHAKTNASKNNYIATTPINITLTEPESTGILGDVNSDGRVTNMDRFVLNRYLAGMAGYTANMINKYSADIDGDGVVSDSDCSILTYHLAKLVGYENLSSFHKEPEEKPFEDTSKWNVSLKSGGSEVEVSLLQGTPDINNSYLMIAEDLDGRHYIGYILPGEILKIFKIKDLCLPRGQKYDFYVIPSGVWLEPNKDLYHVTSIAIPLYNGNMITSVLTGDIKAYNGGNIYLDEDLTIKWDGSYGVDDTTVVVSINNKEIYKKNQNSDGPGVVKISKDRINAVGKGNIKIKVIVSPQSNSGLSESISLWSGYVIDKPRDNEDLMDELWNIYAKNNCKFSMSKISAINDVTDFINNHKALFAGSFIFDALLNLEDVFIYDEFSDYAGTRAIGLLLSDMEDKYYLDSAENTIEVTSIIALWVQSVDIDEWFDKLSSLCENASNKAAILEHKADFKKIQLDNINNSLSQYIEFLYDLAIDEDLVKEEYARILQFQLKNLDKRSLFAKIENAAASFKKGLADVSDALGKLSLIASICEKTYYVGVKDFSADLLKLNIIIESLESYNNEDLLHAALLLKTEMTTELYRVAKSMVEMGKDLLFGWLDDFVDKSGSTIKDGSEAVTVVAFVNSIDISLFVHMCRTADQYLNTKDESMLIKIKNDLHTIAYCRSLINTLTNKLNKMFPSIPHTNESALLGYAKYYDDIHDDIELLFE